MDALALPHRRATSDPNSCRDLVSEVLQSPRRRALNCRRPERATVELLLIDPLGAGEERSIKELRRAENLDAAQHAFLVEVEHDRAVGGLNDLVAHGASGLGLGTSVM